MKVGWQSLCLRSPRGERVYLGVHVCVCVRACLCVSMGCVSVCEDACSCLGVCVCVCIYVCVSLWVYPVCSHACPGVWM